MKINTICCLIVLIILFLYACEQNYSKIENKYDKESVNDLDYEKEQVAERKKFEINMIQNKYHFRCYEKCGGSKMSISETEKRYGTYRVFNISQKSTQDSIIIKFSFIASCCLEYVGDVIKKADTLKLIYRNISHSPCDCNCDYNYQFSLPKKQYKRRFVLLNDSLIWKK